METKSIIIWLILGILTSVVVKFVYPRKVQSGWLTTIVVGLAGFFSAAFIIRFLFARNTPDFPWTILFAGIGGAIIILGIFGLLTKKRAG
ncbi:MAG: hypothetical protein ABI378_16120 [Chitinophagaceae bacterium]